MPIMSLPSLLTGGSVAARQKRANEIIGNNVSSWDYHILDAQEKVGIEDVRELISKLDRKPLNSPFKAALLLEAQNLTLEAQNTLLKTLEEPPENTRIILTAPTVESLLSTIGSRCLKLQVAAQESKIENMNKFINSSPYERWLLADQLNLNKWLSFWRETFLELVLERSPKKERVVRVVKYLKLIIKAQSLKKRRSSPKLLNSILLFDVPTET
jgi:DNA polymerase-3 subunit delta'